MIHFLFEESTLDKLRDGWRINIIVAVVSSIVGFFFSRWLIRYQVKRQAHMNAAIEFRNAFTDILVSLSSNIIKQSTENNLADTVVNNEFVKHEAAFMRYKTYLSWLKKICLQIAWNKYSGKKAKDILQKEFGEYSTDPGVMCYMATRDRKNREQDFTIENELEKRKLARKRIERMLKIV